MALWGTGPSLEPIEPVHKRAAKIIHKLPKSTHADIVLEKANWKTVDYIYKRRLACLTHKIYNNKCPNALKDLVIKTISQISSRNSCKVDLIRSNINLGRNCFKHRAALIWNRLPPLITIQEIMKHLKESYQTKAKY